jgi:hypothetical protein
MFEHHIIATTTATTRRRTRRRHPNKLSVVQVTVIESRVQYLGYSILLCDKRGIEYRFHHWNDEDDRYDDGIDNDEWTTTPQQLQ